MDEEKDLDDREDANTGAQAIIDAVKDLHCAELMHCGDEGPQQMEVLLVPRGLRRIDIQAEIDKRAPNPLRASGTTAADTLDAFIDLTERHATPETVIYVHDGAKPQLTAVINDHGEKAAPGWRDHRVEYAPALSEEWTAWDRLNGEALSQAQFAEHLEDRCLDVIPLSSAGPKTQGIVDQLGVKAASPADLQAVARGLSVKVDQHVKEARRLDTGETQLLYSEEHRGEDGKPMSVPNAFVVAIPVFLGDAAYSHVVRLRYRLREGRITWSCAVVHASQAKRDAVLGMVNHLREKLPGVLVIEGSP